jgi:hypothetical protein
MIKKAKDEKKYNVQCELQIILDMHVAARTFDEAVQKVYQMGKNPDAIKKILKEYYIYNKKCNIGDCEVYVNRVCEEE